MDKSDAESNAIRERVKNNQIILTRPSEPREPAQIDVTPILAAIQELQRFRTLRYQNAPHERVCCDAVGEAHSEYCATNRAYWQLRKMAAEYGY